MDDGEIVHGVVVRCSKVGGKVVVVVVVGGGGWGGGGMGRIECLLYLKRNSAKFKIIC